VLAASGDTDVSVVPLYFISVRATPTGSWIFWAVYRVPIDLWYVIPFEVVAGGGGAPPPRAFGKPWDFPLTSENRRCRAPLSGPGNNLRAFLDGENFCLFPVYSAKDFVKQNLSLWMRAGWVQ
jgi:hypothetical protein